MATASGAMETASAAIEKSSDALVDVAPTSCSGGEALLAQVTEVGRAVYQLKVGDWVRIIPGLWRSPPGARLCVPQADVNCLRLPQRGRED